MDHDHIVTDRIIRAAIEVHRQLGPGLLETPYKRALGIELAHQGMRIETNRHIPMAYRGELIGEYIPDLIVDNTVVVEVKACRTWNLFSPLSRNLPATNEPACWPAS